MSRTSDIQQLYIGLLGRAADAGGLNYWVNSEYSIDEIAARIVHGADEFPQDDRPTMIAALFDNLFNRTATEEDISFWEGWLDQYDATLDVLLMNLIRYPSTQDAATLGNRTFVANAYTQAAAGTDQELDLVAAADVIADVDHTALSVSKALATIEASVDIDLSEALNAYFAAKEARDEFLADALNNKLVAEALAEAAKEEEVVDPENPTADEIAAALKAAADTSVSKVDGLVTNGDFVAASPNVREALLTDALQTANGAVRTAQTTLTNAERTFRAESTKDQKEDAAEYEALSAQLRAAKQERDEAGQNAGAELQGFIAAETQKGTGPVFDQEALTLTVKGVVVAEFDEFEEADGGRVVVTADGFGYPGLQAVVDAFNVFLVANDAVNPIQEERNELLYGVEGTQASPGEGSLAHAESPYKPVLDAAWALSQAEDGLAALEAAIADYRELAAMKAEHDALDKAEDDAEDALTNPADGEPAGLDLKLVEDGGDATIGNDLFIFNEKGFNNATIDNFGARGDDSFYFGDDFELFALGSSKITDRVGSADQLEIFWAQEGNNLVLYVENHPEAGRETSVENVTKITLTGVSADDIAFEGGFLTVA